MKYLTLFLTFGILQVCYARGLSGNYSFSEETDIQIEDYENKEDFHKDREEWESKNILEDCDDCDKIEEEATPQ